MNRIDNAGGELKLNPFSHKKEEPKHPDAKSYDIIVIGSGSGMYIVEKGIEAGLKVALVDRGPAGGTCLNVGCIPSKMLIAAADRVMEIREAERFGIRASIEHIDFAKIMRDMKDAVLPDHHRIHESLKSRRYFDYYEGTGRFIDDYTMAIDENVIYADTIFIASGARPFIPPIKGLSDLFYLTNETLLQLETLPARLAIIGGGYIAAEYGHFFAAMGADVTIIQKADRIVPAEEPEISALLQRELGLRMTVHTGATVEQVEKEGNEYILTISKDDRMTIRADQILVAAGRQSNADLLEVKNSGIETDERGYIRVNEYLETTRKGIWAFGDANGRQMFTHVANAEGPVAWSNAMNGSSEKFDYRATPKAVFTWPPIASVGLTEAAAQKSHDILVGRAPYNAVAKGMALREENGFAKVIIDKQNVKIIGFHIIGPHAPVLIQEVVNAMALGGDLNLLFSGIHIHPAMTELIAKTFSNLSEPEPIAT